ncbi:MAG: Gfo/Idh/MocA family protein [Candidatus Dormibacteria bacterium]
MRLALCGLGSAATRAHVPVLRALADGGSLEVVGVCDSSLERRAHGAQLLGAPGFAEVHRMLHEVEPDVLVVATPPSRHLEAVRTGLNHHTHVVCEKPLGLRRADVDELRRLRKRHHQLGLVSVHQYEYAPAWQSMIQLLRPALADGEPWTISVEVERPGTDPLSAGGWRARPAAEGGILGDHAVHYLSMLWKLAPDLRLVGAERHGADRDEQASAELARASGRAQISVSYAGQRRHNRIELTRPARDLVAVWDDDILTVTRRGQEARPRRVGALSDRKMVNDLYGPFYRELLRSLPYREWREARWAESLGVAALLTEALGELVEAPRADLSYVTEDLRRIGRALRHVVADRGINRRTDREQAVARALNLDADGPRHVGRFLRHCVEAGMLTVVEAAALERDPAAVRHLALTLDGHRPGLEEGVAIPAATAGA